MTRIAPSTAYEVLGVSEEDDFATIRSAWIRLVKENHPDALGGDLETATRRLTRINDAYDTLRWHSPDKIRIHKEQEQLRRNAEREQRQRGTKVEKDPMRRERAETPVNTPTRKAQPTVDKAVHVPALPRPLGKANEKALESYRSAQRICRQRGTRPGKAMALSA